MTPNIGEIKFDALLPSEMAQRAEPAQKRR
jgi:hypothetical protein